MKTVSKLVLALALATSTLGSVAVADRPGQNGGGQYYGNRNYNNTYVNRGYNYNRGGNWGNGWGYAGAAVAGAIIGGAIANSYARPYYQPAPVYVAPPPVYYPPVAPALPWHWEQVYDPACACYRNIQVAN